MGKISVNATLLQMRVFSFLTTPIPFTPYLTQSGITQGMRAFLTTITTLRP